MMIYPNYLSKNKEIETFISDEAPDMYLSFKDISTSCSNFPSQKNFTEILYKYIWDIASRLDFQIGYFNKGDKENIKKIKKHFVKLNALLVENASEDGPLLPEDVTKAFRLINYDASKDICSPLLTSISNISKILDRLILSKTAFRADGGKLRTNDEIIIKILIDFFIKVYSLNSTKDLLSKGNIKSDNQKKYIINLFELLLSKVNKLMLGSFANTSITTSLPKTFKGFSLDSHRQVSLVEGSATRKCIMRVLSEN